MQTSIVILEARWNLDSFSPCIRTQHTICTRLKKRKKAEKKDRILKDIVTKRFNLDEKFL